MYSKCGDPRSAVELWDKLKLRNELQISEATYSVMLSVSADTKYKMGLSHLLTICRDLKLGEEVYQYMRTHNVNVFQNSILGNALLNMYTQCGSAKTSLQVSLSLLASLSDNN